MDWIGVAGLILMVTCIHLILNRGNRLDWLESDEIVIELILAAVGFYLFVYQTAFSNHPFIPRELLRNINFVLGNVLGFFQGALVMLSLVIMPLLLEGLIGYTVTDTGKLILPRGGGVIVGMLVNVQLSDRIDSRVLFILGFAIIAAAGYMMAYWSLDVGPTQVGFANFCLGVGGGISFVPLSQLAFSTVPKRLENEGFVIFYLVYYTGVASGIAVILAVISRSAQIKYSELITAITPFNQNIKLYGRDEIWNINDAQGLAELSMEITRQANMVAYNNGFLLTMICAIAVIPFVLFFRQPRP